MPTAAERSTIALRKAKRTRLSARAALRRSKEATDRRSRPKALTTACAATFSWMQLSVCASSCRRR